MTGFPKAKDAGFAPIELLAVVGLLAMLGVLVLPAQHYTRARSTQAICLANLERIGQAMQMYTEDFNDTFPGHRNTGARSDSAVISLTNWWGTTIFDYTGNQTNLFHCPVLKGKRKDNGTVWEWKFDCHQVGYGINAFFLGVHPYGASQLTVGGIRFDTAPWFKRSRIVKPSECLVVAEKQPLSSPPVWSSSLWWPNSGTSTGSAASEGVSTGRHVNTGTVNFSDGHCEFRRNHQINPPSDPSNGSMNGLVNSRYWDPLQRGGLK